MNERLAYLEHWKSSKASIFGIERYDVSISNELGDSVKARYIEIDGNSLLSRATLWESGSLFVEAIAVASGEHVFQKQFEVAGVPLLDDKLNWWLSEIAIYEP